MALEIVKLKWKYKILAFQRALIEGSSLLWSQIIVDLIHISQICHISKKTLDFKIQMGISQLRTKLEPSIRAPRKAWILNFYLVSTVFDVVKIVWFLVDFFKTMTILTSVLDILPN